MKHGPEAVVGSGKRIHQRWAQEVVQVHVCQLTDRKGE